MSCVVDHSNGREGKKNTQETESRGWGGARDGEGGQGLGRRLGERRGKWAGVMGGGGWGTGARGRGSVCNKTESSLGG